MCCAWGLFGLHLKHNRDEARREGDGVVQWVESKCLPGEPVSDRFIPQTKYRWIINQEANGYTLRCYYSKLVRDSWVYTSCDRAWIHDSDRDGE